MASEKQQKCWSQLLGVHHCLDSTKPPAPFLFFFFNIIPKLRCRLASISYASNLQIEVVIQLIICVAYPPLISLLGFLFDFTR
jgi:hypothetical protein